MSITIETGKCPVCGREGFKTLTSLILHIHLHNTGDKEYDGSMVSDQKKHLTDMFASEPDDISEEIRDMF